MTPGGLRVAMVGLRAPWGAEGGVESAVGALSPRLVARGHEVTVYCRPAYNPHGTSIVNGVRLVDVPTVTGVGTEAFVHSALAAARATARHDVVHLHACGPALFAPIPRAAGRAAVVTVHGLDWEREKWGPAARRIRRRGARVGARTASRTIAVSEHVAAAVRALGGRVTTIPTGVAPHTPEPWDPARFPDLRPGRYVLALGRLVPEKEHRTLLRAAEASGVTVAVVGGAPAGDPYTRALHAHASPRVVFTGARYDAEKRMLLTHARAFALPSRVEGLSIALLEAAAAGLPLLVSAIPPNLEVIGDAPAWRLPVGDDAAWARALAEVEQLDADALARIGRATAAAVCSRYDWDAVTTRTEAVYRAAMGA